MGAPWIRRARSTISMARSTPAQNPRGCARTASIRSSARSRLISEDSKDPDLETDPLPGQRMIEIEDGPALVDLLQDAGETIAVRPGKFQQIAGNVANAGLAVGREQAARYPLHEIRIAQAERLCRFQLENPRRPLLQALQ